MKAVLALSICCLVVSTFGDEAKSPLERYRKPVFTGEEVMEFIEGSIKEGLAQDDFPRDLAKKVAERKEDFIIKCGLCMGVERALFAYSRGEVTKKSELKSKPVKEDLEEAPAKENPEQVSENENREKILKALQSEDAQKRREALRDLVEKYISQGYEKYKMETQHEAAMHAAIDEIRKFSMKAIEGTDRFCPSCDGTSRFRTRFEKQLDLLKPKKEKNN